MSIGFEHTTLKDDECLSVDIDEVDINAAIEEEGWCGTYGSMTGNPVVFQAGDEPTLRPEAEAYLTQ